MKLKRIVLALGAALALGTAQAQWVVSDPGNLAQGIINSAKEVVEASKNGQTLLKSFQETSRIYQQGKQYYDALKQVKTLVKNARKVQQTVLMVGDITDIYVTGFRKMLADTNFSPEELEAIASGYSILLEEAANAVADLKETVNENGLSIDDKGRIDLIDRCYEKVRSYRSLTQYYTDKNIGVSYLRAKKRRDTQRVLALYGTPEERCW